ncbi:MAG: hypothetical protein B7Z22_10280, partial [Hyphomonas sp. 32-62-5]
MDTIPGNSQSRLRQYGAFNGLGLWTLYKREVGRFLKVWMQTVFAPVVTTLLFMTVFKLAFGDRGRWYIFAAASGRAVGLNMLR